MAEPRGAADDELGCELALEQALGQLATELPGHLRAFAAAYAAGRPAPAAPAALRQPSTIALAGRACGHPALAGRGQALWRLAAPAIIDDDPAVIRARAAAPSWPALAALAVARDQAAARRLGHGFLAAIGLAHGVAVVGADGSGPSTWPSSEPPGPALAAWTAPREPLAAGAVSEAWRTLARRHGVVGAPRVRTTTVARPRAFVIVPGAEVEVVVPAVIATAGARFAALHELGHALVALHVPRGTLLVPRVLDEAVAGYVARALELEGGALPAWSVGALATAARARRRALAAHLAAIEAALPALPSTPPAVAPPWALWHDGGAQATYVAAEALGDELWRRLGADPPPGALGAAIDALLIAAGAPGPGADRHG